MINVEEVVVDNETTDVIKSINDIINVVKRGVIKEEIKKTLFTNVKELLVLLEDTMDNDKTNNKTLFNDPFEMFKGKEESKFTLDKFKQIVESINNNTHT